MQETQRFRFEPQVRKIPCKTAWQTTPVFLPRESQGQKSLAGYNPQSRRESDTTEVTPCTNTCVYIYTTICEINSQWEGLCNTRSPAWCSVMTQRGGAGGRLTMEAMYTYVYTSIQLIHLVQQKLIFKKSICAPTISPFTLPQTHVPLS